MFRDLTFAIALAAAMAMPVLAQDSDSANKNLDIRSPVGNLHLGDDADARKIGVPLYPGARLKSDDENRNQANLSVLTEAFGMKLIVANYVSKDDPAKIIDFYRSRLKKYGKVLECHSAKHGGDISVNDDNKDSHKNKELKCDKDSAGPVTELKVGTEDNQRIIAVEPDSIKGSTFALVYVHTRGKMGDI